MVSVNATATDGGNGNSDQPRMSADGRYVLFATTANNLGPADAGADADVYRRDLVSGTTELVSVNAAGTDGGNGVSAVTPGGMTPDGRLVLFNSRASDLGPTDPGTDRDVYLRDMVAGMTTLVSVNADGTDGASGNTFGFDITPDGRYAVIQGLANNLGPADAGNDDDVYVRDLVGGTTILVSANAAGTDGGDGASDLTTVRSAISDDGRYVAFRSLANNLGPPHTGPRLDVYVRDLVSGTTELASPNIAGTDGVGGIAFGPELSADGRKVSYTTPSMTVHPLANGIPQIYLRDLSADQTILVTVSSFGGAGFAPHIGSFAMTPDARYFAFAAAGPFVPPDSGTDNDVFVRDMTLGLTEIMSVNAAGTDGGDGVSNSPAISDDGRFVGFLSAASDLGPLDPGADFDFYVRDRASGITALASMDATGTDGGNGVPTGSQNFISPNGRVFAWATTAGNHGPPDAGTDQDVYAAPNLAPVCTISGAGNIVGTRGSDVICGSGGPDNIAGGGGSDIILAGGGNDRVDAGAGDDQLFGADGDDILVGGYGGADSFNGGLGNDTMVPESGEPVDPGPGTNACFMGRTVTNCLPPA